MTYPKHLSYFKTYKLHHLRSLKAQGKLQGTLRAATRKIEERADNQVPRTGRLMSSVVYPVLDSRGASELCGYVRSKSRARTWNGIDHCGSYTHADYATRRCAGWEHKDHFVVVRAYARIVRGGRKAILAWDHFHDGEITPRHRKVECPKGFRLVENGERLALLRIRDGMEQHIFHSDFWVDDFFAPIIARLEQNAKLRSEAVVKKHVHGPWITVDIARSCGMCDAGIAQFLRSVEIDPERIGALHKDYLRDLVKGSAWRRLVMQVLGQEAV